MNAFIRLNLGMWEVVYYGRVVGKFYSQGYADRKLRELISK